MHLDMDVLARAQDEARTLITFDKDFGELAFRRHLPTGSGIVLFRFEPSASQEEARIILTALGSRPSWAGYFAVVERHRIRLVPLPSAHGSRG